MSSLQFSNLLCEFLKSSFRSKRRFYEFAEHVNYRHTTTIKCTKFTTFSAQVQTLYKMFVPVLKRCNL